MVKCKCGGKIINAESGIGLYCDRGLSCGEIPKISKVISDNQIKEAIRIIADQYAQDWKNEEYVEIYEKVGVYRALVYAAEQYLTEKEARS